MPLRERTRAGLEAARARGRKGGRKPKFSGKQQELALALYRGKKHTVAEICHLAGGMSRAAFYKVVGEAKGKAGKR